MWRPQPVGYYPLWHSERQFTQRLLWCCSRIITLQSAVTTAADIVSVLIARQRGPAPPTCCSADALCLHLGQQRGQLCAVDAAAPGRALHPAIKVGSLNQVPGRARLLQRSAQD